jgi:5-methylcytosine-specific restriction endonuclease McrA
MPSDSTQFRRNSEIVLRSRPNCVACGEPMLFKGDLEIPRWWLHPKAATVNHKVPTIQGGTDDLGNLEPMHRGCNSALGNQQRRSPDNRRLRDFGTPRLSLYDG